MARTTLETQLAKLRKQREAIEAKEKALLARANDKVIAEIVALAKKHNVTIEELSDAMDTAKRKRSAKGTRHAAKAPRKAAKTADKRAKVAPKYRNPANAAETWTGRGRTPLWVQALKTAGQLETAVIATE
ncbi:MAG: H-NS histone family protein [Rhodoferax sp.]|nr:MAG: H-NS histone family protein [Rhodoferax sp.]